MRQGVTLSFQRLPKPLVQLRGAPSWGSGERQGAENAPFPRGCWVVGWREGLGARAPPRLPHNLGRTQGSGSQLLLGSGVLPSSSLPVFLSGYPPNQSPPHTAAGKGRSQAPLQPTPCSPDEGAKGEMGGVVEVKITDPFIKGKSENPKKIMIKRCANDDVPPRQRRRAAAGGIISEQSTETSFKTKYQNQQKMGEKQKAEI